MSTYTLAKSIEELFAKRSDKQLDKAATLARRCINLFCRDEDGYDDFFASEKK